MNNGEVVSSLRQEKAKLELQLRRVNLALEALLSSDGKAHGLGSREKKLTLTCQNPQCKKTYKASRKDAKYCQRSCALAMDKRRIDRGVTLVQGAQK